MSVEAIFADAKWLYVKLFPNTILRISFIPGILSAGTRITYGTRIMSLDEQNSHVCTLLFSYYIMQKCEIVNNKLTPTGRCLPLEITKLDPIQVKNDI